MSSYTRPKIYLGGLAKASFLTPMGRIAFLVYDSDLLLFDAVLCGCINV